MQAVSAADAVSSRQNPLTHAQSSSKNKKGNKASEEQSGDANEDVIESVQKREPDKVSSRATLPLLLSYSCAIMFGR